MKRKITKAEAEARGFAVDSSVYPWVAYSGPRFKPTRWFTILTDLEAELLDALKLAQTHLEFGVYDDRSEGELADGHQVTQQIDYVLNKV